MRRSFVSALNILLLGIIITLVSLSTLFHSPQEESLKLQVDIPYALNASLPEKKEPDAEVNEQKDYQLLFFKEVELNGSIELVERDKIYLLPIPDIAEGYIYVFGKNERENKEKIIALVETDKQSEREIYYLDLDEDGFFYKKVYLRHGVKDYNVSVLYNVEGSKYRYVHKYNVKNTVEVNKFLTSYQDIDSEDVRIISKAKEITEGKTTDYDKIKAVYEWVSQNHSYDYDKKDKLKNKSYNGASGSIYMLLNKKGVCYDYATLSAALLRSLNIPMQVVVGDIEINGELIRHAWNKAYDSEKKKWIVFDTTFGTVGGLKYFDNDELKDKPEEKVY